MANKDLIFTVLGIDRASRTFDKVGDSMDKMADRAVKGLLGVTGASAASAAAVAAAVGGLPLAFIGLAAVALRENDRVKDSFSSLSNEVQTGLAADAAPLADNFIRAAHDIGAGFQALRPQMREAFAASQPAVDHLVDSVLGFANNAMPGMVEAVKRSGPVLAGMESLAKDAGTGVGEFFRIVSSGSRDAGRGIEHLGGLMTGALPDMGRVLTDLTGVWAEHGDEAVDVINRIIGVISDLSGGALPIMGDALGVALDVLDSVLDIIGPMADGLGPLIGLWLSLGTALKAMRGVQGILIGAAGGMTGFADATRKAATAGGISTFRAGLGGIVGLLGGPWGIAIGAGIAALALFGNESDEVSSSQRSLAEALRDSGGAFNAQSREIVFASDEYRAVADAVDAAGLSHRGFLDAVTAGGDPLNALRTRLQGIIDKGTGYRIVNEQLVPTQTDVAKAAIKVRDGIGPLRGLIDGATGEAKQWNSAMRGTNATLERQREKLLALTDPMFGLISAVQNVDDAQRAYNKALKEHGPKSKEARARAVDLGEAVAGAEAAALDGGLAYGKFDRKLRDWVRAGMLTERQANQIRASVRRARGEAERFSRDYRARIYLRGDGQARRQIRVLTRELLGIPDRHVIVTTEFMQVHSALAKDKQGIGRAHGGRVPSGAPTLVGEHHPELFVPDVAGRILSPSQSATALRDLLRGGDGAAGGAAQQRVVRVENINLNLSFPSFAGDTDALMRTVRSKVRDLGGDVQKALGQN